VVPKRTNATPLPSAKKSESVLVTTFDYLTCTDEDFEKHCKKRKRNEHGANYLEKFKGNLTEI
jgi:hypothetical protein